MERYEKDEFGRVMYVVRMDDGQYIKDIDYGGIGSAKVTVKLTDRYEEAARKDRGSAESLCNFFLDGHEYEALPCYDLAFLRDEVEHDIAIVKKRLGSGRCASFITSVLDASFIYQTVREKIVPEESGIIWHRYPDDKPSKVGEYLVRGIGGVDDRLHHWVCLWVDGSEVGIPTGFYYGGNEFKNSTGTFEWTDVKEL